MARINLTPQQLSAFLHLSNTGSFRDAARLQRISQPSLSRTIQAMEQALGRRLFDRTTRRVQLTPTGSELRPIAERLIAEFDTALGDLAQFLEGRRGRVVIAALPSISAVLLPGAIARFLKENASVDFQIRDGLSATVVETVVSGKADMGLTVRPTPAENLSYRALAADAFGLVCRPDHPLAREASSPWTVFANEPFIAMDPHSSVRAMTDAAFMQVGIAVRPLYECAFLATTGNLVAQGLGITALPRLTLPMIGARDLVWRPLVSPSLQRSLGVVTSLGRSLSPAASAFLDVLADHARNIAAKTAI
jgi:LysR family carnitine catabolism transcriptional activator